MESDGDYLSEDFASALHAQTFQEGIPGWSIPAERSHRHNTNGGRSSVAEECKQSALAVETGRGDLRASYPSTIFEEYHQESTPPALPEPAHSTNIIQTVYTRRVAGSSEIHSPVEEKSPYGSPNQEKTQALALPKSTANTSLRTYRAHKPSGNLTGQDGPSRGTAEAFAKWGASSCEETISPVAESSHLERTTQALFLSNGTISHSERQYMNSGAPTRGNDDIVLTCDILPPPSHPAYEGMFIFQGQSVANTCPDYADYAKRLLSFREGEWPFTGGFLSAQEFAEAGMFYLGPDDDGIITDRVYCFKCGESMHSFQPEDDPAIEHRKLYPECSQIYGGQ